MDRSPFNPDSPAPGSRFWGVDFLSQHWASLHTEAYYFGLDDGSSSQDRELSTLGFRLFKNPTLDLVDYEIESMYQFGLTQGFSVFAQRHHGEIGYTFTHPWRPRLTYLFDFASGDPNPARNFDFLFAKRRAEYGPTGILGIIFPSNILSPAGFRLTFEPLPNVHLWILDRSFCLADSQGPFVGTGLQDPTCQSGNYVGNLLDTAIHWDPPYPFLHHATFEVGYTRFFKGSYYARVPDSPGTADVDYFYLMTTIGF